MGDDSSEEMGRKFKATRARIREIEAKALRKLGRNGNRPKTRIVVQNYADQFVLSRKQLETIMDVLPNRYFKPIEEILLCSSMRNEEPFEYVIETKTVYFSYPVKRKTREDVEHAVEALLVGLARIQAGDTFIRPLRKQERQEYDEFVALWKAPVMDALFA
jgi:hypothetical protein